MAEVTLADFIAWEPGLALLSTPNEAALDSPIGWVVSARAGTPMLPPLRGGELVVIPERVLESLSAPLEEVLAGLRQAGVAAAVFVSRPSRTRPAPMPLLIAGGDASTGETESALNRSLTELRGELYRSGAELSRVVARLSAEGATPEALIDAAGNATGLSLSLRTGGAAETAPERGLALPVRPGLALAAEMGVPRDRALAALALETLALPIRDALRRDEDSRPRGSARADALRAVVLGHSQGEDGPNEAGARKLGLSPVAVYRVAAVQASDIRDIEAALGPAARVHDAGADGALRLCLIEWGAVGAPPGPTAVSAALERLGRRGGQAAVSRPHRFPGLGIAGAEALLLAHLQASGEISRQVAVVDDPETTGAFALLVPLAGSPDLAAFSFAVLGKLPLQDRRGELHRTLKVFLECGGAHGETADRLGIHRNTLAYRLRQITQSAALDVADPANWIALHLAVLSAALERTAGDRPSTA